MNRVPQKTTNQGRSLLLLAMTGAVLGGLVAWINPGGNAFVAWLGGTLLSISCLVCLFLVWKKMNGTRLLAICIGISVVLRILVGFGLTWSLPIWGHKEEPPRHGYIYLDAYRRDTDAWNLAQSGDSLTASFGEEFISDQYGGLLALSAGIYRLLSPDAHRPVLILLLTAFLPTLGIPFLWNAVRKRWNDKLANLSMWIYALYPESIILSSAQMREPFLIGLSTIAFWGVVEWRHNHRPALTALLLSLAGMAFFSSRAALAILALLVVWFWFDNLHPGIDQKWRRTGWIILGLCAVLAILFSLDWVINTARWDLYLMESSSGRIQFELDTIGMTWRVPFIVTYGLLQPVLPATLVYPTIPIMQSVNIYRAVGWYVMLPLLLFAFIALWRSKPVKDRGVMALFLGAIALWVLISSVRAGGDQWDNVRYRSIFLVWMAVAAAWAYLQTFEQRSAWLKRILLVEGVFILAFIQWYLSRYYRLGGRLPFWQMIALLVVVGVGIIGGGFIRDHFKKKHQKQ